MESLKVEKIKRHWENLKILTGAFWHGTYWNRGIPQPHSTASRKLQQKNKTTKSKEVKH